MLILIQSKKEFFEEKSSGILLLMTSQIISIVFDEEQFRSQCNHQEFIEQFKDC
jgi:hypothetical protein